MGSSLGGFTLSRDIKVSREVARVVSDHPRSLVLIDCMPVSIAQSSVSCASKKTPLDFFCVYPVYSASSWKTDRADSFACFSVVCPSPTATASSERTSGATAILHASTVVIIV